MKKNKKRKKKKVHKLKFHNNSNFKNKIIKKTI